ncbi:MAG: hypothetical protein V3W44_10210 [Dehalococcoidales bacterium]
MSLVHIDSCGDAYSADELVDRFSSVSASVPAINGASGRNGTNGIECSTASQWFEVSVPDLDTYFSGIAFKPTNISTTTDLFTFKEDGVDHVIIRLLADGSISVVQGDATVLGTSSAGLIIAGSFTYLEVQVVIDDTAGVVVVNKDGVEILNLTALDTNNGGTSGVIDVIRFQGSTDVVVFDDLYILNATGSAPQNTFLGDSRIDASFPSADGDLSNISEVFPTTPTTHFDKVDEVPPDGDTTYVTSATPNQQDLYALDSLFSVEGADAIYGVQLNLYAKKDNEGGRQVLGLTRPDATTFDGSTGTLTTAYQYFFSLFDQDPDTAVDWTEAGKNAAQFGVEVL